MDGACLVCALLPAFTHQGYECHDDDLFSLCDGIHARTDWTSLYTLIRESSLGNGVRTHVNSKGKIPSTGGSQEDQTHDTALCRTVSPTHYRLSCAGPTFCCMLLLSRTLLTLSFVSVAIQFHFLDYLSVLTIMYIIRRTCVAACGHTSFPTSQW